MRECKCTNDDEYLLNQVLFGTKGTKDPRIQNAVINNWNIFPYSGNSVCTKIEAKQQQRKVSGIYNNNKKDKNDSVKKKKFTGKGKQGHKENKHFKFRYSSISHGLCQICIHKLKECTA